MNILSKKDVKGRLQDIVNDLKDLTGRGQCIADGDVEAKVREIQGLIEEVISNL